MKVRVRTLWLLVAYLALVYAVLRLGTHAAPPAGSWRFIAD